MTSLLEADNGCCHYFWFSGHQVVQIRSSSHQRTETELKRDALGSMADLEKAPKDSHTERVSSLGSAAAAPSANGRNSSSTAAPASSHVPEKIEQESSVEGEGLGKYTEAGGNAAAVDRAPLSEDGAESLALPSSSKPLSPPRRSPSSSPLATEVLLFFFPPCPATAPSVSSAPSHHAASTAENADTCHRRRRRFHENRRKNETVSQKN